MVLIQCFVMAHLCISMQVHHVCGTYFSPLNQRLYWVVVVTCLFTHAWLSIEARLSLSYMVLSLFGVVAVAQWHFILNVVSEISNELNIGVLRILPKDSF